METENRPPQARLIVIYADKKSVGFYSPMQSDNLFECIPTFTDSDQCPKLDQIGAAHDNRTLWEHLSLQQRRRFTRKIRTAPYVHFDPDPIKKIYGDRLYTVDTWPKWRKIERDTTLSVPEKNQKLALLRNPVVLVLRQFKKDDILVWAARFTLTNGDNAVFIVGWLKVAYVLDFQGPTTYQQHNWAQLDHIHIREQGANLQLMKKYGELLLVGQEDCGGQLEQAIRISSQFYVKSQSPVKKQGFPILQKYKSYFKGKDDVIYMIGNHELDYDLTYQLLQSKATLNPR